MIDLKLPEYRIKEFKYQLKEGKTAIIKLFGGVLDDIEIIEEPINKSPFVEEMSNKEVLTDSVKNCKKEKKVNNSFNKLSKVNAYRCKELMAALDGVPYKVMEKMGELITNGNGEGVFVTEPDPYIVNDERELPKQKKMSILTENEKSTLDASKEKDWKDSMKNDIITKPMIVTANLDKKYEDMTTGEKREISKQIIEKNAKEDTTIIKERVENAIGSNEPLSDELINAPEQRAYNEVPWTNKNMEKSIGKVPDAIKKVWKDDLNKKNVKENG